MTYNILIIAILGYWIFQLEKRLRSIEGTRGPGFSHNFSISCTRAIFAHKKFGEITGIKSASLGKEFKDWSKSDKERWDKMYREKIGDKTNISVRYLQSENSYFVKTYKTSPIIISRGNNPELLYSTIVVGDEDGFGERIELLIYERLVKDTQGKYFYVLSPCLQYSDGLISSKKEFFITLCDFPLFKPDISDDEMRKLGFEVKRQGGDDWYEDSFGTNHSIPLIVEYTKNGVEIRYVS